MVLRRLPKCALMGAMRRVALLLCAQAALYQTGASNRQTVEPNAYQESLSRIVS